MTFSAFYTTSATLLDASRGGPFLIAGDRSKATSSFLKTERKEGELDT